MLDSLYIQKSAHKCYMVNWSLQIFIRKDWTLEAFVHPDMSKGLLEGEFVFFSSDD